MDVLFSEDARHTFARREGRSAAAVVGGGKRGVKMIGKKVRSSAGQIFPIHENEREQEK